MLDHAKKKEQSLHVEEGQHVLNQNTGGFYIDKYRSPIIIFHIDRSPIKHTENNLWDSIIEEKSLITITGGTDMGTEWAGYK